MTTQTRNPAPATNNNRAPQQRAQAQPAATNNDVPEGFEVVNDDLVGFWNGDCDIMVRLLGYTLSDAKPEPGKDPRPQAIIHGELLKKVKLIPAGERGDSLEPIEGRPGDRVGIWYKPGLRDVLAWGGIAVFMKPKGEREMGEGKNAMKLFKVAVATNEKPNARELECLGDYRRQTRSQAKPWESNTTNNQSNGGGHDGPDNYDDFDNRSEPGGYGGGRR